METQEFLLHLGRMCGYFTLCEDCPVKELKRGQDCSCVVFMARAPQAVIDAVEKWAEEHPAKTRLTDFLEKYPNATILENTRPKVCCQDLGYCTACPTTSCRACWNTPV